MPWRIVRVDYGRCARIALLQMYIWLRLLSAPCERRQGLCKPDVDGVDSQA